MKLPLLAAIACLSLAGCGTLAGVQSDITAAGKLVESLKPVPVPVDPVMPLGPAKVYTPVPQNEK